MSGGEQQMCAMARALMARPRLMMVDEMSLGLAPVVVDLLLETMTQIRSQGVTVLLVEQDVHAALSVADRGYVMETGEIVREGTARELESDPEVQRAYLGEALSTSVKRSSRTRSSGRCRRGKVAAVTAMKSGCAHRSDPTLEPGPWCTTILPGVAEAREMAR